MYTKLFVPALVAIGLVAVAGSIAIAQQQVGETDMPLPPGWTQEDMQACMEAGTPGEMHTFLAEGAGTWTGKNTMWMAPDTKPATTEVSSTVTPIMDGRYVKCEMAGEMPGMGAYKGLGYYGYDNVTQNFVSTWIDNHSTGIMQGTGKLSPDKKTLTWKFTYNCPVTKKQAVMREIETMTGPDTKTIEMFGADPKSGKEYKMMSIELTRKSASAQAQ